MEEYKPIGEAFRFKYPKGEMTINADEFFPAPKARLKKLIKTVIVFEYDPEATREYVAGYCDFMVRYIREQINGIWMNTWQVNIDGSRKLEKEIKDKSDAIERALDAYKAINKRSAGGKRMREIIQEHKAELKDLKARYKGVLKIAKDYKRKAEKGAKDCSLYQMNAEVLRDYE